VKEWFKARNIWGAAITALSDEEAGRVAKAVWAYTMDGEIQTIEGAGKGILAMILMTLAQDEERDNDISAKRSYAAKVMHLQVNADKCKQVIANASKCSNKNQNKNIDKEQESESESEFIADAEAREIQTEQNRVLDAAEDAGFAMSNDVRASLIALYAENGLEKMLDGLKSCSEHGAAKLAYLRAVLKGEPKKQKPKVVAQDFQQRSYEEVDSQMMDSLAREVAAFNAREVG
jgi:hypothetical protein